MDTLEQEIVSLLKAAPASIASFRQLIRELGSGADQRHELRQVLHEMVKAGSLAKLKGNRYGLPAEQSVVAGRLSRHRDGYGFVIPQNKPKDFSGDVFIPARFIGDAMQGDTVLASVEKNKSGNRVEGKILKVLERKNLAIVGQFKKSGASSYVIPFDSKIEQEIVIPPGEDMAAAQDAMVNVEITRFARGGAGLRGRVIEVLGFRGDFGIDVEIMIRKHQIPVAFPSAALFEVDALNHEPEAQDFAARTDFRALPIVTIDGETAKDFDDAVHVERLDNGNYRLGVHIADVSHYVKKDSALDREAAWRGTSVYFPDRAVPMLPEELSNGICSLKPQLDRLALSALMEIDHTGQVVGHSFHEGIIRSHERMTYTSVGKILIDQDSGECARYRELVPHFALMRELALLLYEQRKRRGSIDFDLPEPVITFDELGSMTGIGKSERNIAHRIIEEFMLIANETVARHLFARHVPSLYRIHETPDPVKVLEFNEIARSFGYRLTAPPDAVGTPAMPRLKDRASRLRQGGRARAEIKQFEAINLKVAPRDYQRLAEQLAGKPEERILSYLMLRSLKQAVYSPNNKGHFGLASGCYTHFTSPIRRYPDLVVHRLLRAFLRASTNEEFGQAFQQDVARPAEAGLKTPKKRSGSKDRDDSSLPGGGVGRVYGPEALEGIALHSSETERRADQAERELMDLKKLEFMGERLGEQYEGIVIHLTREGMVVELLDLFVEGIVSINTLEDDDYGLCERPLALVGRRFKKTFRLGDRRTFAVDRINRFLNRVELSVVQESKR